MLVELFAVIFSLFLSCSVLNQVPYFSWGWMNISNPEFSHLGELLSLM